MMLVLKAHEKKNERVKISKSRGIFALWNMQIRKGKAPKKSGMNRLARKGRGNEGMAKGK